MSETGLGGRIPLLDPSELTPSQKSLYDFITSKMVPWADASGFKANCADGKLIGPFNAILHSPEINKAFLELQENEQEHTSLNARIRQVVILTVGAIWQSEYELYAHSAVARKVGFSETAVNSLRLAEPPEEVSSEELLAQRFVRTLVIERKIDEQLYKEALAAFDIRGIVEIVLLVGCYTTVSSLLNVFCVPALE